MKNILKCGKLPEKHMLKCADFVKSILKCVFAIIETLIQNIVNNTYFFYLLLEIKFISFIIKVIK